MSWVIWITGLLGSGKTTLAHTVREALAAREITATVLSVVERRADREGNRKGARHESA